MTSKVWVAHRRLMAKAALLAVEGGAGGVRRLGSREAPRGPRPECSPLAKTAQHSRIDHKPKQAYAVPCVARNLLFQCVYGPTDVFVMYHPLGGLFVLL